MDDFERLKRDAMKAVDAVPLRPRVVPEEKQPDPPSPQPKAPSKKCSKCAMDIPKQAEVCPYCHKSQKASAAATIFMVIFVIAIIGALSGTKQPSSSPTPAAPKDYSSDAFYMSQEFVKDSIKAPATAKFPMHNEAMVQREGENIYIVNSYVDAQNSFGALLRNNYTCRLERTGDRRWKLLDINMYGR